MKPVCLIGPTACGKSAVALALAERTGGEIVSVDSMQVYRGMDVGTAKPTTGERARVRHHLVDVAEVDDPYDAARFCRDAEAAIREIGARGRLPILCGGTGFYLKAWLDGLGEAPTSDPALRAELEAAPIEALLEELAERDPVTHDRIDRRNPRRVVRAVEVIRLTGKPFSRQRADWETRAAGDSVLLGLRRDADDLRERIDRRVDGMFADGLVAEVEALLGRGLERNRSAAQAIGYRQVSEHLRGERGLAETVALVKTRTWQFARRQMTWFRNQLRVEWMDVGRDARAVEIAESIAKR
jgi:tRNA dimethylallyltransferase